MQILLPNKKYQIIYADPPWEYKSKECLDRTSILNGKLNTHYNTMSLDSIKKLDVKSISDKNCMLFLWVVSPMLPEGLEVMKSWGFKYSTIAFVWYKQKSNPGNYTMSECEICLVGRNGKIPENRGARNVRQFLSEAKGKHSAKPNEIKKRIELMFPNHSKIELFARSKPDGWDVFGDEVDKEDFQLKLQF